MSNKPSSIIINNAKIDRIDPENVGLEVSANVLDSENNAIPDTEVALIINRLNIDTIISDSDGFIDIKKTLELQEGENISVQLKEVISGVKSSVRMISDVPNFEQKNINGLTSSKQNQKNGILTEEEESVLIELQNDSSIFKEKKFDSLRGNKDFVLKAIKINPFLYEYISDFLKDDDDVINTSIDTNIEYD